MSGVILDESHWPVGLVTFFDDATDAQWQAAADTVAGWVARGERCAIIIDGTHLEHMPNPVKRKIASDMTTKFKVATNLVAWGNVITSTAIRGAITAINWLTPTPAFERRNFSSCREAMDWAKQSLAIRSSARV